MSSREPTQEVMRGMTEAVARPESALSPAQVIDQVRAIQSVMSAAMKEGDHYGVIPGTGSKPSLLKAGAEKLLLTFRLGAFPDVTVKDLADGHREYTVTCTLRSLVTDTRVGVGVGSATTMETKWRYRQESTGREVPGAYWKSRDPSLLGGHEFTARKKEGKWYVFHRVSHDNPADYYNTCLKMAKKRALVDAVLTSLAASDIFTQDVEEMEGLLDTKETAREAPSPPPSGGGESQRPKPASGKQAGLIYATLRDSNLDETDLENFSSLVLNKIPEGGWGYNTVKELIAEAHWSSADASVCIDFLKSGLSLKEWMGSQHGGNK